MVVVRRLTFHVDSARDQDYVFVNISKRIWYIFVNYHINSEPKSFLYNNNVRAVDDFFKEYKFLKINC